MHHHLGHDRLAPLAFAPDLDPGAVDRRAQRVVRAAVWNIDRKGLPAAAERGSNSGARRPDQLKRALDELGGLSQRHAEQDFHRQRLWMAASLWRCLRPRLPVGAPSHLMAGPNQIVGEPRRFGASLQLRQFVVFCVGGVGSLMNPVYPAGFAR